MLRAFEGKVILSCYPVDYSIRFLQHPIHFRLGPLIRYVARPPSSSFFFFFTCTVAVLPITITRLFWKAVRVSRFIVARGGKISVPKIFR